MKNPEFPSKGISKIKIKDLDKKTHKKLISFCNELDDNIYPESTLIAKGKYKTLLVFGKMIKRMKYKSKEKKEAEKIILLCANSFTGTGKKLTHENKPATKTNSFMRNNFQNLNTKPLEDNSILERKQILPKIKKLTIFREGLFYFNYAIKSTEKISNESWKSTALRDIAKAQAEAGMFEDAIESAGKISNEYLKSSALREIAKAQAEAGMFEDAIKSTGKISDENEKSSALREIAKAQAEAGMFEDAEKTFEDAIESTGKISIEFKRSVALRDIAKAQAEAGCKILNKIENINEILNLNISEKSTLLKYSLLNRKNEIIQTIGYLTPIEDFEKIIPQSLNEKEKQDLLLLLGYGKAEYFELISDEDKSKLFQMYRSRFENYIKTKDKNEYLAFKLINEIFKNSNNNEIIGYYIQTSMNLKPDSPELPRIFKTLSEIESLKGNDIIIQMVGNPDFNYHLSLYFINKMIENNYLNLNKEYFIGTETKKEYYVKLCKLLIRELGINPDNEVIKYIDEKNIGDFNQKTINLDSVIQDLKTKKEEFTSIKTRDSLIKILSEDEDKAVLYYILNGGKTRFALVNNYSFKKFFHISKIANTLEYHNDPLNEFLNSLKNRGMGEEQISIIREKLIKGEFPLGETFSKKVRIDVSDSANLERINSDLANIFGSEQLGAILKYAYYKSYLKEKNTELYEELESVAGLGNLPILLRKIEEKYPEIKETCEKIYDKDWKKIGEKKLLELSIHAILDNDTNEVAVKKVFEGLETQRKALMSRFRQMYKSGSIDKMLRNEKIRAVEEKGRAKLMRFVMEEIIRETDDKSNMLFDEWESHLDAVFNDFEILQKNADFKIKTQEKTVNIRWLNKKDDLVECFRFADSAQCCFNSKNYTMEGQNVGAADWIARIWKDPLSFVFQIEDEKTTENEKVNAIGFVFGSFGLVNGELVVMLNGVYMQGKTDTAAQSIVNLIEQEFSIPLNAKLQIVASRHNGTINYGEEYSNKKIKIKRLRAIKSKNENKPESVIYDDLAPERGDLNKEYTTDENIWHKILKN